MKILNTELKPLRPLPSVSYDKMKGFLEGHASLHYFAHQTYCRLVLNFNDRTPYTAFLERAYRKNNGFEKGKV